jgi:hypothetical protein
VAWEQNPEDCLSSSISESKNTATPAMIDCGSLRRRGLSGVNRNWVLRGADLRSDLGGFAFGRLIGLDCSVAESAPRLSQV